MSREFMVVFSETLLTLFKKLERILAYVNYQKNKSCELYLRLPRNSAELTHPAPLKIILDCNANRALFHCDFVLLQKFKILSFHCETRVLKF